MQGIDLRVQRGQIPVVGNHIMGMAQTLIAMGLSLQNGPHLLLGHIIPRCGTGDLQGLGHVHHQHPLGHLILPRLHQQRRHQQRIGRLGRGQISHNLIADQRMQQLLQPAPFTRRAEHLLAPRRAVQRTIFLQYCITKAVNNPLQRRPARLHHHPRLDIRIHHMNAMRLLETRRRSTLATANAAGQTDDEFV